MKKLTVEVGQKFNKLTVIAMKGINEKGFSVAECRCDCGNQLVVKVAELRSGHKKTCGCGTWKSISADRSQDIVGKRFGRLVVTALGGTDERKYRLVDCLCDCGRQIKARIARLISKDVRSCGCLQIERAMENLSKAQKVGHRPSMTQTLTGRSWFGMIRRCYNPECNGFAGYGAAGIRVCEFLRSSPINLVFLIGERPHAAMSLDRINTLGMYSCGSCAECLSQSWPLNVRWATAQEQALNKTTNTIIEIDGVTKTAKEWMDFMGLSKAELNNKLTSNETS